MRKNTANENTVDNDINVATKEQEAEKDLSGMSLAEKIDYWKATHKKLYKTEFGDEYYIWRRLKRREYVRLISETEETEENKDVVFWARQEAVCRCTVLYPEDIDEKIENCAGLASTLAEEIMYKSGFSTLGIKTNEI